MTKDSTLDAFSGEGEPTDEEDKSTADAAEITQPTAVSPAISTYAWSPAGTACASCGDSVNRRWRDGDDLVCESCKSW